MNNLCHLNEWAKQAAQKLEAEKKAGKYNKYAQIMKERVCETLKFFCRQDREFAQAVVQGGTFENCMKAVAADARTFGDGHGIPDPEAFRRAVRFYFPGADVTYHMTINLCADVEADAAATVPASNAGPKIIDLEDFL